MNIPKENICIVSKVFPNYYIFLLDILRSFWNLATTHSLSAFFPITSVLCYKPVYIKTQESSGKEEVVAYFMVISRHSLKEQD
jgi:hypothetical protein